MRVKGKQSTKPFIPRRTESEIRVLGAFQISNESEKAIEVQFGDYKGKHWIPKSVISDDRFLPGRSKVENGDDLSLSGWFFTRNLRPKLEKKYNKR